MRKRWLQVSFNAAPFAWVPDWWPAFSAREAGRSRFQQDRVLCPRSNRRQADAGSRLDSDGEGALLLLLISIGVSAALMLATGAVHYEVLRAVSAIRGRLRVSHRTELFGYVAAVLFAHLVCVSLYALAYAWMHGHPRLGALQGRLDAAASDFLYFSVACYTSLGFGDVYPVGPIRIVAGIEALNGLLLIAWSAAFTVHRLERLWRDEM